MNDSSLESYCQEAIRAGAKAAKVVHPSSVVTAAWVRLKCQFGCTGFGKRYCCPPDTPAPAQTRELLDGYGKAILFHLEGVKTADRSRRQQWIDLAERLVDLEGELFKDGYYKALILLAGPCHLCQECAKLKAEPCNFGGRARPSMEACGIDVYQTAKNNGFPIHPLKGKGETQNNYCLMLVD